MKTIMIARYKIEAAKRIALRIASAYPPMLHITSVENAIVNIENIGININTIVIEYTDVNTIYELERAINGLQMTGAIDNDIVVICYMSNDQWADVEIDERWILI
jgi:hypothetical protein